VDRPLKNRVIPGKRLSTQAGGCHHLIGADDPPGPPAPGAQGGSDRLSSDTLHALKNKLGSILVNTEYLLADQPISAEEIREVVRDIQLAAGSLKQQLEELAPGDDPGAAGAGRR
jgi:hypothetical protein